MTKKINNFKDLMEYAINNFDLDIISFTESDVSFEVTSITYQTIDWLFNENDLLITLDVINNTDKFTSDFVADVKPYTTKINNGTINNKEIKHLQKIIDSYLGSQLIKVAQTVSDYDKQLSKQPLIYDEL